MKGPKVPPQMVSKFGFGIPSEPLEEIQEKKHLQSKLKESQVEDFRKKKNLMNKSGQSSSKEDYSRGEYLSKSKITGSKAFSCETMD